MGKRRFRIVIRNRAAYLAVRGFAWVLMALGIFGMLKDFGVL